MLEGAQGGPVPVVPVVGPGPGPRKTIKVEAVPVVPVVPAQIDWSGLLGLFDGPAQAEPAAVAVVAARAEAPATAERDRFEETAAVLEFDMGLSQAEAEKAAAEEQGFASAADLLTSPEAEPAGYDAFAAAVAARADFEAMADPWRAEAWR